MKAYILPKTETSHFEEDILSVELWTKEGKHLHIIEQDGDFKVMTDDSININLHTNAILL